jgi:hypothetical protein
MSNFRMVLVGDTADAADDWIAERIGATDVCVTSDIPLAAHLAGGSRVRIHFLPAKSLRTIGSAVGRGFIRKGRPSAS